MRRVIVGTNCVRPRHTTDVRLKSTDEHSSSLHNKFIVVQWEHFNYTEWQGNYRNGTA